MKVPTHGLEVPMETTSVGLILLCHVMMNWTSFRHGLPESRLEEWFEATIQGGGCPLPVGHDGASLGLTK